MRTISFQEFSIAALALGVFAAYLISLRNKSMKLKRIPIRVKDQRTPRR